MGSQSEQLEREVGQARAQLSGTLRELRTRITPGQVIDQFMDYTRQGPVPQSLRNLGREIRDNPLPLALIGIGIAWLMVASSRASREAIANAADSATEKTVEFSGAASGAVFRSSDWGQPAEERASDLMGVGGDCTAELADVVAGVRREWSRDEQ